MLSVSMRLWYLKLEYDFINKRGNSSVEASLAKKVLRADWTPERPNGRSVPSVAAARAHGNVREL